MQVKLLIKFWDKMIGFYICLTIMLLSMIAFPLVVKFNSNLTLGEIGLIFILSFYSFWIAFVGLIVSAIVWLI